MKKTMKYLLVIIILFFVSFVSVYAVGFFNASDVSFDNNDTGISSTNVQNVIEELNNKIRSNHYGNILPLVYVNDSRDSYIASGTRIDLDLSKYEYFLIELYSSNSSLINLVHKSEESQRLYTNNLGSYSWAHYRDMVIDDDGISLGSSFSSNGTNNNVNIYRIWGVNSFDLLWTNPSPDVAMSSNTKIDLDLTDYNYLVFNTYYNGNEVLTLLRKYDFDKSIYTCSGNTWGAFRNITDINDTGVVLGGGWVNNGSSNMINPYKIYGIREFLE